MTSLLVSIVFSLRFNATFPEVIMQLKYHGFTCPQCGGHLFGTATWPNKSSVGHCNTPTCGYKWDRSDKAAEDAVIQYLTHEEWMLRFPGTVVVVDPSHKQKAELDQLIEKFNSLGSGMKLNESSWLNSSVADEIPYETKGFEVSRRVVGPSHDPYEIKIVQGKAFTYRCGNATSIIKYDSLGSTSLQLLRNGLEVLAIKVFDQTDRNVTNQASKLLRDMFTCWCGTSPEGIEKWWDESYERDPMGSASRYE